MSTISEEAKAYEPPKHKTIADLEVVPTSMQMEERTFKKGTEDEFTVKVINLNGVDYRVPTPVLSDLKAILEEKKDLKFFKVIKKGTGLNTTYTVVTLDDDAGNKLDQASKETEGETPSS